MSYTTTNRDFDVEQHFSFVFQIGQMVPKSTPFPFSQVLRVNLECSEELNRHNNTVYYAGMFMGIGASNLISELYGVFRTIPEIQCYGRKNRLGD